jgi:hypothetical protein
MKKPAGATHALLSAICSCIGCIDIFQPGLPAIIPVNLNAPDIPDHRFPALEGPVSIPLLQNLRSPGAPDCAQDKRYPVPEGGRLRLSKRERSAFSRKKRCPDSPGVTTGLPGCPGTRYRSGSGAGAWTESVSVHSCTPRSGNRVHGLLRSAVLRDGIVPACPFPVFRTGFRSSGRPAGTAPERVRYQHSFPRILLPSRKQGRG